MCRIIVMMRRTTASTLVVTISVILAVLGCILLIVTSGGAPSARQTQIAAPSTKNNVDTLQEPEIYLSEARKSEIPVVGEQAPAPQKSVPEYPYKLPQWRVELLKAIFKPVSIECFDVPFENAVDELANKLGVKIEIDSLVLGKKLKAYLKNDKSNGLNVLHWLMAMDPDEEIGFKLQKGRIFITLGSNEKWSKSDIVFFRIDTARQNIWLREQEQKYLCQLRQTPVHRFDWVEKTVSQALDEIRAAYNLKIDDSYITHWSELQDKAPRVSWKVTAFEALETLLENTPFNCAVVAYEKSLSVRLWQKYEGDETMEQHYQRKCERFNYIKIEGGIEGEPFHKLIKRLEQPLGVVIQTDESTWKASIKVSFPNENPTAKELLDYLQEKHGIEHWFEMNRETGKQTLFLLKTHQ